MAAVIAGSGAAAAKLLQRPVHSLARCSRQQYLRLRAQHTPATVRSFTSGRRALEKKYTEDHEWIDISSPESASIGISTYAAKALGDVVYVELPTVDTEVNKGDAIGAVESVKSASDIMTPVGGTIIEVNSELEEKPGTINKSPEGDGWLAKIKVTDTAELEGLMDAEAYRAFTEEVEDK
ncbi:glycine cleavage system H-protein subunit [Friedmanniomyces endolithicus]|nr:glycine cleavage system H-protein subunit [Friedmanniomyces endolithicus]